MSDDCSNAQSIPARYMCKANPIVRFSYDTTLIEFNVIHKTFSNISTHEIERISLKLSGPAEDCNLLIRHIRYAKYT